MGKSAVGLRESAGRSLAFYISGRTRGRALGDERLVADISFPLWPTMPEEGSGHTAQGTGMGTGTDTTLRRNKQIRTEVSSWPAGARGGGVEAKRRFGRVGGMQNEMHFPCHCLTAAA